MIHNILSAPNTGPIIRPAVAAKLTNLDSIRLLGVPAFK
ncbi:hypothetical protein SAMN06265361_1158 [Laceyella tengchongensis]|uniref:Uncharacterized protein n=1 Tax=Laceyella tengchongensis TaxID=574699 RepID=A0AA46AH69_9BACL|nr:hypothetical protein SAMN06265361_1158 [Laceyella tengchongensis]